MKVDKITLEWKDMCCGCNKLIPAGEEILIVSEIACISGSLHFCEKCVEKIKR